MNAPDVEDEFQTPKILLETDQLDTMKELIVVQVQGKIFSCLLIECGAPGGTSKVIPSDVETFDTFVKEVDADKQGLCNHLYNCGSEAFASNKEADPVVVEENIEGYQDDKGNNEVDAIGDSFILQEKNP